MTKHTCSVEDCDRPTRTRGYCGKHYENFRRTGNPISLHEQRAMRPKPICSVDGCERVVNSRNLCSRHYQNLLTLGQPIPVKDLPLAERMDLTGWTITASGCWEWGGKRNGEGYGIVYALRHGLRGARAHRVMYELHVGPIPEGEEIRHKCDNPPCVNPDHLEPGTHLMNMDDMTMRGRSPMAYENRENRCKNGHDMTAHGAFKIVAPRGKRPYRTCVECARRRSREYQARQRAK